MRLQLWLAVYAALLLGAIAFLGLSHEPFQVAAQTTRSGTAVVFFPERTGPRIEVVHRRPVWGMGDTSGDMKIFRGETPQKMKTVPIYGPFGYAVPPVPPGATRQFRMYGVYSDGVTHGPGPVIRFSILTWPAWEEQAKFVDFQFPNTWGGLSGEHRDAYSNAVANPKDGMHAYMYTFIPQEGRGWKAVKWQYAEIQTLDVY